MSKKKDLSPALKAECDAAKALFTSRKNSLGLTQAKIAEAADISPAAVAMYLNGQNPLNPKFAAVLSRLLGEPVEAFSPRLAAELKQMHGAPQAASTGAADKVRQMLEKVGKGLPAEARQQIIRAASEGSEQPGSNVISADFSGLRLKDGDISIPQYDIRGAMGHGQMPSDYVEFMRNVVVSGPQMEKLGLDFTSPANLSIITGWGQSMAPTIQDKDPVIVDRGVTEFSGDAIYVLTWQDHLFIKRVHLAAGGKLKIISDSRPDDPELVMPDDVVIHAKVLLVWNARKV